MSSHLQSALNSLFSIYANNIKVNNPPYDNSSCLYATHYMTVRPFESVFTFNEGLAAVKEFSTDKKTTKWGFVDKKFEQAIPYKYDKVNSFVEGLAYFNIGNIEGYINKNGKVVWSHTSI